MTTTEIRIDIISDVTCPWCIVGYKKLQQALSNIPNADKIKIQWQPFALNPGLPEDGELLLDNLKRKYNMSEQDSLNFANKLKAIGAKFNFEFNIGSDFKMYDTNNAHVLLHWAQRYNKQTELKLKLFEYNFSDNKNINDENVLLAACEEVGLNLNEAQKALHDETIIGAVKKEKQLWASAGINSVPSFVFNKKYLVNGAQEPEQFIEVINTLFAEQNQLVTEAE
ncbi:DsbA family oxidoreductase [Sessilibacter sp. MAH4]